MKKGKHRWSKKNPKSGQPESTALVHGAYSYRIRQRYSDRRTREGRRLGQVMDSLVEDLGGPAQISAGQQILLGNIRSRLITLWQIGEFADRQESVISEGGQLLPCLGKNYTSFAEGLRRDLESLYSLASKNPKRAPSIRDVLKNGENE